MASKKKKSSWKRPGWETLMIRVRPEVLELINAEVEARRVGSLLRTERGRNAVINECIARHLELLPRAVAK